MQPFEKKDVEFSLEECNKNDDDNYGSPTYQKSSFSFSNIADIKVISIEPLTRTGGSGGGNNTNITCYTNSDCGEPIITRWCSGNYVCSSKTGPSCLYPGTVNSFCENNSGGAGGCSGPCPNGCFNGYCIPEEDACRNADINRDGVVDNADYILWRKYEGCYTNVTNSIDRCYNSYIADINKDGIVGQKDYDIWKANFGKKCPLVKLSPLYLQDPLNKNVKYITPNDLPTVLKENNKFVDDEGNEYIYNQTIILGSSNKNALRFSNSELDLNSPNVIITLSDNPNHPIYSLDVSFSSQVPFNSSSSEGEKIELFGKKYTISTATDHDTLVLIGGGGTELNLNAGESIDRIVNSKNYEVSILAISTSDTTAQASISVNGQTATFTEGQIKRVSGIDVFVKTIFRTGDNQGYVILELGADRLSFENGKPVMKGSDNDAIPGTLVTLRDTVSALSTIEIDVSAPNNDLNHIDRYGKFIDPVFGTISLDYVDLKNGPLLERSYPSLPSQHVDYSLERRSIKISQLGQRELGIIANVKGNDNVILPFTYWGRLADDGNKINVVEGEILVKGDYVILNSGNYQYFMELTKIALGSGSNANSDVHFKDLLTGKSYTTEGVNDDDILNSTTGTKTTFTIDGQTFIVEAVNVSTVKIYSSDYSKTGGNGTIDVYPTIKTIDGKNHMFAYAEKVTIKGVAAGTAIKFPEGRIIVNGNIETNNISGGAIIFNSVKNGDLYDLTIGLEEYYSNNSFVTYKYPSLIFYENIREIKPDYNLVIVHTDYDGYIMNAKTPQFTGNYDTETFDDTQYTGYLTTYGTYVLRYNPIGSDDATTVSLTYPENQMYAEVFVSERF